jgi:hypothetical protein
MAETYKLARDELKVDSTRLREWCAAVGRLILQRLRAAV